MDENSLKWQHHTLAKAKTTLFASINSSPWISDIGSESQFIGGQSRHGLDLGDPKNTASPLIAPHIETVGRLLVWSDCLYTRDDILLPTIVLVCRWPNFPKPGNTLTLLMMRSTTNRWIGLGFRVAVCSVLPRLALHWFNGLMRRRAV